MKTIVSIIITVFVINTSALFAAEQKTETPAELYKKSQALQQEIQKLEKEIENLETQVENKRKELKNYKYVKSRNEEIINKLKSKK